VSNASLYDGGSAVAEAALMAVRAHRRSQSLRLLIPSTVNPHYRRVVQSTAGNQGVRFETVPYLRESGCIDAVALEGYAGVDITALVIQQPNFFGQLEDVDRLTDWAHAQGMLVIAVVNPTSLAVLKPPGEWGTRGADICVGEGQPLGVPLSSGGPYFGFMTTRMEYVRSMPGRIVGCTVDLEGRPGYTLTLQAREQHIRRGRATSNICTNQGLLVTAATIYMTLVGPTGLARAAERCMAQTTALVAALGQVKGLRVAFAGSRFHEAVVLLERPAADVLRRLEAQGILGGVDLAADYPELGPALLACATETKTADDLQRFVDSLRQVLEAA
jgi:glycine dehydrogenase subunit 1